MMPNQVYVLMFWGTPLKAFTSFEGANEAMADYTPERQRRMKVEIVDLVNDDKS